MVVMMGGLDVKVILLLLLLLLLILPPRPKTSDTSPTLRHLDSHLPRTHAPTSFPSLMQNSPGSPEGPGPVTEISRSGRDIVSLNASL